MAGIIEKKKEKKVEVLVNNSWNWFKPMTSLDGAYKVVIVCQV